MMGLFTYASQWLVYALLTSTLIIVQSRALRSKSGTPDVSELPSSHKFQILGMSVYDNPDDSGDGASHWWKWFMPSYYKKHLKGRDLDFSPQKRYNDTSYCQLRYYGFLKKLGSEGYWDGGYATLTVPQHDKPLNCYYQSAAQSHVNIGHGSKHAFEREQAAKQLMAFAIYCPLPEKRKKVCEALDTKTVTSELRLFPVGWEKTYMAYPPYVYLGCTFTSKKGRLELPQVKPNMGVSTIKSSTPIKQYLPSTEMMVCTVQTFQNEMSGPMLYMFAKHYSLLGFQVLIYDRYGRHQEFVQELIDTYFVIYHPFTSYEFALPEEYSAKTSKNEKGTFKFFYHFEVNDKFSVADDTRLQDQDKMITYDTARVQYSSYRIFLAVDSDELLVPDPHTQIFRQFQRKHSSSSSPSWGMFNSEGTKDHYPPHSFKAFVTKTLSKQKLVNTEEVMLFRYTAAATTPSGTIHPKNITQDGDMVTFTSACLHEGYKNRDILAMARCYSSSVVYDRRFVKFIDTQSTCAFHYLHNGCNLIKGDPPLATSPEDVVAVDFGCFCSKRRASIVGMYLLHLNHNNFCSKVNRKKDPDEVKHGTSNPLLNNDISLLPSA